MRSVMCDERHTKEAVYQEYLALYKGDQGKVVEHITAEEYDAQPHHIQKRQPFILNLRAKLNAVAEWLAGQERG